MCWYRLEEVAEAARERRVCVYIGVQLVISKTTSSIFFFSFGEFEAKSFFFGYGWVLDCGFGEKIFCRLLKRLGKFF